jgi:RNA-directed DNA polymerase
VGLDCGESFGFLGFDFRRIRSLKKRVWREHFTPKLKKRTALLRKIKEVFRRYQSQPINRVVQLINPMLRRWVNYLAVGAFLRVFQLHQGLGRKKVRRHMERSRNRRGSGWKACSRRWFYDELKLFNRYRVRRGPVAKVFPAGYVP